jgi:hypothetical protein
MRVMPRKSRTFGGGVGRRPCKKKPATKIAIFSLIEFKLLDFNQDDNIFTNDYSPKPKAMAELVSNIVYATNRS